jgi:hypothetical protein
MRRDVQTTRVLEAQIGRRDFIKPAGASLVAAPGGTWPA